MLYVRYHIPIVREFGISKHNFFRVMVEQWTHLKQNEQVITPFEFPYQYTISQ